MSEPNPHVVTCPTCGQILPGDALVCSKCGGFVYRPHLEHYAAQATQLEQTQPAQAAAIWRQCLPLLPANSPQYQNIVQRIAHLSQMQGQTFVAPEPAGEQKLYPQAPRRNDTPVVAIGKTVGSMIISATIYAYVLRDRSNASATNWPLAIGFVLLMLVHEMGHVFALWYYGLSASPPIFIPFLGAMINLRQSPPNALAEGVVGMGGPFLGSIGAILCFCLAVAMPQYKVLMNIAFLGVFLNLFNLLPVPPLDGGRITAALSPKLWIVGLILLIGLFSFDWYNGVHDWLLILVLIVAWPRIKRTLRLRHQDLPYYQVPTSAAAAIGVIYLGLAITLIGLMVFIRSQMTLNI
jgi:Zn-dependent protease